jgi:hypothetical protein
MGEQERRDRRAEEAARVAPIPLINAIEALR